MLIPGLKIKKPLPVSLSLRDKITKLTCDEFGTDFKKVFAKGRKRNNVLTRQVSMLLIKSVAPHETLKSIGQYFGGRDHTTAIHGINTVNNLMQYDTGLRERVNKIQGMI